SRRRPHANPNANTNNQAPRPQGQGQGQAAQQAQPGLAQGQNAQGSGGGQRRRPNRNNNNNRPRNPNQGQGQGQPQGQNQNNNNNGPQGLNIERIYEKYLNLLDQHLVARRKYHDLFYRADHGQKHKLERNFYNTLNDIRDFEDRLAPAARELFEKRNNGLNPDNIYTTNHELPVIGDNPPPPTEWADPHFLHSQDIADFKNDKEESAGSLDDYLKYKNLI
ncbi:MAG: hypothetical protein Q7U04_04140, partial [Bacteriovorax sp.]|nr:hypothetical protein [Bacteriovorax sp.]